MLRSHQANSASPEISYRSHAVSPRANRPGRLDRIRCFLCPEASSSLDCELLGEEKFEDNKSFRRKYIRISNKIKHNLKNGFVLFVKLLNIITWGFFIWFVNKGRPNSPMHMMIAFRV
jgi:hypothetical protein